jgi:hypothetical protein
MSQREILLNHTYGLGAYAQAISEAVQDLNFGRR